MDQMAMRAAIVLDGTDRPVAGGTVAFPVATVAKPRRPVAGLLIALVTAVVTMGAMGPRPAQNGRDAASLACATPDSATTADAESPPAAPAATSMATPVPWWLLPQMALWVDPATGRVMQDAAHDDARVADDRHRDR